MIHSPAQRKALWGSLTDLSNQVPYHGLTLSKEDYKLVFTASLKGELRMVPSLDMTSMVVLGHSIKEMEMADMADLLTLVIKFGDSKNVRWTDPKIRSLMGE